MFVDAPKDMLISYKVWK